MFGFGKKKSEIKKVKPKTKKDGVKITFRKPSKSKITDAHNNTVIKPQKRVVARKTSISSKTITPCEIVPVTVKKHRDNKGNHNHVILASVGNKHVSVGLTTQAKKGKNSTNYRLQKDTLDVGQKGYKPKNPTFMRRQGTVDDKTNYHRELKGSMTKKDYKKAVEYGNKAKEKFFAKKK